MKLSVPMTCFIIGFLGLILGVLINLRSLKRKATVANLIFDYKKALLDDWIIPVINFIVIIIELIVLPYRTGKIAEWSDLTLFGLFLLSGISGSVLLFAFISVANKKFNAAIDYKTNIADEATGTLGTPTPVEAKKP